VFRNRIYNYVWFMSAAQRIENDILLSLHLQYYGITHQRYPLTNDVMIDAPVVVFNNNNG